LLLKTSGLTINHSQPKGVSAMPNHCDNYLALCGEDIKSLKAFHKAMGNEIDFNKVIPMPQALCDQGNLPTDETCPNPNWRDWACIHWGTKWNAYEQQPRTYLGKVPRKQRGLRGSLLQLPNGMGSAHAHSARTATPISHPNHHHVFQHRRRHGGWLGRRKRLRS